MKKTLSIFIGIISLLLSACAPPPPNTYVHGGYYYYGRIQEEQTILVYRPYEEVIESLRRHVCQCLPMSITSIKIDDENVIIYVSRLYLRTTMIDNSEMEITIKRVDRHNILLPHTTIRDPYAFIIKVNRIKEGITQVQVIGPNVRNWRKIFTAVFAWSRGVDLRCPLSAFTTYKEPQ